MYYKGNDMVKDLKYGGTGVKAVYHQNQRIYPNIVDQKTGFDHTDWEYDLPDRTRTETPWTQDVYADGTLGEKVVGIPVSKKETASVSEGYEEWTYNVDANTGTRTRVVNNIYKFTDITKTTFKKNETENGVRSQDTWVYDWVNSKRTANVTYTFKDATRTATASENGTVSYNFTITPIDATAIAARGGSKSINATGNIGKKWNNTVVVNTTATVTSLKFSGSTPAGFTLSGLTVIASGRGSIEGTIRTASVCGIATVDGKILNSTAISVNQAANTINTTGSYYLDNYISNDTTYKNPIRVGINGGSLNLTLKNVTLNLNYSSGTIINVNTNVYKPTLTARRESGRLVEDVWVSGNRVTVQYKANQAGGSIITESFYTSVSVSYNSKIYSLSSYFTLQSGS